MFLFAAPAAERRPNDGVKIYKLYDYHNISTSLLICTVNFCKYDGVVLSFVFKYIFPFAFRILGSLGAHTPVHIFHMLPWKGVFFYLG